MYFTVEFDSLGTLDHSRRILLKLAFQVYVNHSRRILLELAFQIYVNQIGFVSF